MGTGYCGLFAADGTAAYPTMFCEEEQCSVVASGQPARHRVQVSWVWRGEVNYLDTNV